MPAFAWLSKYMLNGWWEEVVREDAFREKHYGIPSIYL